MRIHDKFTIEPSREHRGMFDGISDPSLVDPWKSDTYGCNEPALRRFKIDSDGQLYEYTHVYDSYSDAVYSMSPKGTQEWVPIETTDTFRVEGQTEDARYVYELEVVDGELVGVELYEKVRYHE